MRWNRGWRTDGVVPRDAEFFSFGTNDLTQTALGISRDDMGNFMMPSIESEVVHSVKRRIKIKSRSTIMSSESESASFSTDC